MMYPYYYNKHKLPTQNFDWNMTVNVQLKDIFLYSAIVFFCYVFLFFCKAFFATLFSCCLMQTCPLVYKYGKYIAWGLKIL